MNRPAPPAASVMMMPWAESICRLVSVPRAYVVMDHVEIIQVCVQGQPLKQGGGEREENQERYQPVGRAIRPEIVTQKEKYDRNE